MSLPDNLADGGHFVPSRTDPAKTSTTSADATAVFGLDAASWAARLAEVEAERDAALDRVLELITACDNFRTENARLNRELQAANDALADVVGKLDDAREERNALVGAMWPVVAAAEAWAEVESYRSDATMDSSIWLEANTERVAKLLNAVSAYRAAQNTPPSPPETTLGHERAEVEVASEGALCRSEYVRPGGSEPGDRIVRCGRRKGHLGDHDEMIEGEAGNWWPQELTPADPR